MYEKGYKKVQNYVLKNITVGYTYSRKILSEEIGLVSDSSETG